MKCKRLVSALCALTMAFGMAGVPAAGEVFDLDTPISASVDNETFTEGDYTYTIRSDETVTINKYSGTDSVVEIPSTIADLQVTMIGMNAFRENEYIREVIIPDTVEMIDANCFMDCENLYKVVIPDSISTIPFGCFRNDISLKEVNIPYSVTNLGGCTFYGCESLKKIELPPTLSMMGEYDFAGCINLTSISIPGTTKHIGLCAFQDCTSLCNVELNEGIIEIGTCAFNNCKSLLRIDVPKSATIVGAIKSFGYANNKKIKGFVLGCYEDSAAMKYAVDNGIDYVILKEKSASVYPEITKVEYDKTYHQFRIKWNPVEGAENYGIAVYLAGKWRIQTQTIPATTTTFTSPKLKSGQTYKMLVCAKVNGKWDTSNANSRAFTVTVK